MAKTVNVNASEQATVIGGKLVKKHSSVGTYDSTAKVEFESRLALLDEAVAKAVVNGTLKIVDYEIYSTKCLNESTTVELMESADQKKVGLRNLNKRQLEANTYAGIQFIQVLYSETSDTEDKARVATDWKPISDTLLRNGELEIKQGDKIIYPRNSMVCFCTTADAQHGLQGMKRLENMKILVPLTDIVPTLWLPAATKGAIKIVFKGVKNNG